MYRKLSCVLINLRRCTFKCLLKYLIVCLCFLHLFIFLNVLFKYNDINYASAVIRNDEEYRFATAFTLMNKWLNRNELPFSYKKTLNKNLKSSQHPSIVFAILSRNRPKNASEPYETHYLIESVVSLIKAIKRDLSLYSNRFFDIQIIVYYTNDCVDRFSDFRQIKTLIGSENIYCRLESLSHLSLGCAHILDTSNCLLYASTRVKPNDFVIIMEDDMISNKAILSQLTNLFESLKKKSILKLGLIQLHQSVYKMQYSWNSLFFFKELMLLSIGITLFLFVCCLKMYLRSFDVIYNLFLIFSVMFLITLILTLIGRYYVWLYWHKFFRYQSMEEFSGSSSFVLGSATMFLSKEAKHLAHYLGNSSCLVEGEEYYKTTKQIISYFEAKENLTLYSTFPNMFRQRGLYSFLSNNIRHPIEVE